MITTTFKQTESLDINLPKSKTSFNKNSDVNVVIFYDLNEKITIKTDNKVLFSSNLDDLSKEIGELNLNTFKAVHLSADSKLDYGKIVNLMSILIENKIKNLNLDTEKF